MQNIISIFCFSRSLEEQLKEFNKTLSVKAMKLQFWITEDAYTVSSTKFQQSTVKLKASVELQELLRKVRLIRLRLFDSSMFGPGARLANQVSKLKEQKYINNTVGQRQSPCIV